jgi:hypothetical protein
LGSRGEPADTGGGDRRIVFECKARKRRPTVANALDELDAAMLNRDAQVAVMLFPARLRRRFKGNP